MTIASTSREAYHSIKPTISKQLRQTVFKAILYSGSNGLTIEEIALQTGIKLQTVCARRNELGKSGLVVDSGARRCTESGRTAKVWIVPAIIAKKAKTKLAKHS